MKSQYREKNRTANGMRQCYTNLYTLNLQYTSKINEAITIAFNLPVTDTSQITHPWRTCISHTHDTQFSASQCMSFPRGFLRLMQWNEYKADFGGPGTNGDACLKGRWNLVRYLNPLYFYFAGSKLKLLSLDIFILSTFCLSNFDSTFETYWERIIKP